MTESIGAVGFVGLGALGSEMALRLVAEGFDVMVFNRTAERTEPLVRAGASRASSLAELASSCETVLGCLRDGAAMEAVYLSATGILDHLRSGQIICEHGTFPPALARRIADEVGRRGATFLDVPVSGGRERARSGELAAMAGGDGDALDRIAEVLAAYTSSVTHVGGAGKGLELKLINQLLVSIHMAAAAEAASLVQAVGLELTGCVEVLSRGWAQSTMLCRTFEMLSSDNLVGTGATIEGMVEVQDVVAEIIRGTGTPSAVFEAARAWFSAASNAGAGHADPAILGRTPLVVPAPPSSSGVV